MTSIMRKIIYSLIALIVVSAASNASISFDIQADQLQTSILGDAAPTSTLVMLIADINGDGIDPLIAGSIASGLGDMTSNGLLLDGGGGDDLLLWRGDLSTNGTPGLLVEFATLSLGTYGGATWSASSGGSNQLSLLWFPSLTQSSTTLAGGESYGIYSAATSPGDSTSSNWFTPSDGTTSHSLYAFTESSIFVGDTPDANLVADMTVAVPEPSQIAAVIGALALGLVVWRRRK